MKFGDICANYEIDVYAIIEPGMPNRRANLGRRRISTCMANRYVDWEIFRKSIILYVMFGWIERAESFPFQQFY